jgi:hypothetical protein
VCLYHHVASGVDYAVKFDPKNRKCTNVLTECLFLRDQGPKMTKFPKYQKHSTIDGRRYLIMEYLPLSIEEYIEQ